VTHKDRIKGSANQEKGTFKQVAGKVTGDAKPEAEGKGDKLRCKVQTLLPASKLPCAGSDGSRDQKASLADDQKTLDLQLTRLLIRRIYVGAFNSTKIVDGLPKRRQAATKCEPSLMDAA
jgi:uncharacterized protein YjbJ (UPF0337 family)